MFSLSREISSYRTRILLGFACMGLVALGAFFLAVSYYHQQGLINQQLQHIEGINQDILHGFIEHQTFLNDDLTGSDFYRTTISAHATQSDLLIRKAEQALFDCWSNPGFTLLHNQADILSVIFDIQQFQIYQRHMRQLQIKRGFLQFGVEGRMRVAAHELERNLVQPSQLIALLQLRRHEKDFINRCNTLYVEAFQRQYLSLRSELRNDPAASAQLVQLDRYAGYFGELVAYDQETGLKNGTGLKSLLNNQQTKIANEVRQLLATGVSRGDSLRQQALALTLLLALLLCIFAVGMAWWIARVLSTPLRNISSAMQQYLLSGFSGEIQLDRETQSSDEFGVLARSFLQLRESLDEYHLKIQDEKEIAQRANSAKGQFLAHMSHEIRTPMNGVLGAASLLKETQLDHEQQSLLEIISYSTENLLQVIKDILDFSKIEEGKLRMECIPFSIHEELTRIAGIARIKALNKGLFFAENLEPRIPHSLMGDPYRLSQILDNLLDNAIKFTEKGTVTLQVRIQDYNQERVTLRFEVADTGPGVALAVQPTLFQPFIQADLSTTRVHGGTGLGLSIARELVHLMGGTIGVKSDLGDGACFWIELSLSIAPPKEHQSVLMNILPVSNNFAPIRILVVDDNPVNQKVIAAHVRKLGHEVDLADNGLQGVEKWSSGQYDVVLMDIQMPVMDGWEATRNIRELEKIAGIKTRIIAVTANVTQEDKEKSFAAGMDAFLTKPVSRPQIEEALNLSGPLQGQPA